MGWQPDSIGSMSALVRGMGWDGGWARARSVGGENEGAMAAEAAAARYSSQSERASERARESGHQRPAGPTSSRPSEHRQRARQAADRAPEGGGREARAAAGSESQRRTKRGPVVRVARGPQRVSCSQAAGGAVLQVTAYQQRQTPADSTSANCANLRCFPLRVAGA